MAARGRPGRQATVGLLSDAAWVNPLSGIALKKAEIPCKRKIAGYDMSQDGIDHAWKGREDAPAFGLPRMQLRR
jgi:hypothetical protein